ncbi:MAG TPA: hypothetical protein VN259_00430 [Xanthomonadales bacterium]|nr:hypothetical protein [Xanthomonadales bacterium]
MKPIPMRVVWMLMLIGVLGACAAITRDESLRSALYAYSAAVRWNEITQASGFVDPLTRAANPFTTQLRERWAQVQVSRYVEVSSTYDAQGRFLQTVEIEVIDRASQSVRTIVDHQVWRYDPQALAWWLESGLPELD